MDDIGSEDARPTMTIFNPNNVGVDPSRATGEVVEIPGGRYRMFACTRADYAIACDRPEPIVWLAIGDLCVGMLPLDVVNSTPASSGVSASIRLADSGG